MEEMLKKYKLCEDVSNNIKEKYKHNIKELEDKLNSLIAERDREVKPIRDEMLDTKENIVNSFLESEDYIRIAYGSGIRRKSSIEYLKTIILGKCYSSILEKDYFLEINSSNIRHSKICTNIPKYSTNNFLNLKTLTLEK